MIDSAIGQILNSGVIGAIAVILGAAVVYKDKQLNNEKDGRLQDNKEIQDKLTGPLETLSRLVRDQTDSQKKDNETILDAIRDNTKNRGR